MGALKLARTRNEEAYAAARDTLLDTGMKLIRANSYDSVGINDILRESNVPKGSFYHYFDSKETFGLAVLQHYHAQQLKMAQDVLKNEDLAPVKRLKRFFETAYDDFEGRDFSQGCLMCNLSTELGASSPGFQAELNKSWSELSAALSACISKLNKADINLSHLSDAEAAEWLLNAWSGALTRMKARGNGEPLQLFLKSIFKKDA